MRERKGWTEYALYYAFLSMIDARAKYHLIGYEDVLLALEASAWYPRKAYIDKDRRYTRSHFDEASAPFVAVQSWLPQRVLLHGRKGGLEVFYDDLETWFTPTPPILARRAIRRAKTRMRRILRRGRREHSSVSPSG
ncbi:DUF6492 family protein [Sinisalibacter lacisalsi]|uniref:Uncharacterized protein n=1 Tax=Sinisalibacter lacisalsi TaxID=1526570 RepID=A0ABQ1QR48_9RHOB|nr:DUF6492 family protein [Sinisalibacter lacisalsi]GGD40141.1 hypothetical protein GCM10011358_25090 [Sinisalibacter lacisalsi]